MIVAKADEGKLELVLNDSPGKIITEFVAIGTGIADGFLKNDIPKPAVDAFFRSAIDVIIEKIENMEVNTDAR